jgi:hypothetical protein
LRIGICVDHGRKGVADAQGSVEDLIGHARVPELQASRLAHE